MRLRGELSGVKHEREELGQRISYTRREVEVLGSQFMGTAGSAGEVERMSSRHQHREGDGGADSLCQGVEIKSCDLEERGLGRSWRLREGMKRKGRA